MPGRSLTAMLGLIGFALMGAARAEAPAADADATETARSPNVIILFADDLGYGDLSSYGHPRNHTPQLDALAAEGQRWTDFYVAAPVCSPSRGALLTGNYPVRTGLYGERLNVQFPGDPYGMPPALTTLAEFLQNAGYRTGMFGKWHLGDAPEAYPTRHGFDEWLGIPYSNDMDWTKGPDFEALMDMVLSGHGDQLEQLLAERQKLYFAPKVEYWNVPLLHSRRSDVGFEDGLTERPADQPNLTRRYTLAAEQFIRDSGDTPFFVYLPYAMPHTPLFRSEAFAGHSAGGLYGDVIEEIDWSVGRIRTLLEELGIADDTLVVFSSDNGPWLAMRHHGGSAGLLNNGKGTTFEGGMRVPAIFWWPDTIEPAVVREPGSTLDLFPTVAALLGRQAESVVDGVDLSATLLSGAPSARDAMAYYRAGELQAYRLGRWKLRLVNAGAYNLPPEREELASPQLYDMVSDPAEAYDRAVEFPDVVARLQAAIAAHRAGLDPAPPLFDRRLADLSPPTGE